MNVLVAFSGDFPEGNSRNARLKAVGLSLKKAGHTVNMVSVRGTRFGLDTSVHNPSLGNWEGIRFYNLISPRLFYKSNLHRIYYALLSVIKSTTFVWKRRKSTDVLCLELPRFTDTIYLLFLSKLLGIKTFVDLTEKFSLENNSWLQKVEEWIVPKLASHVNCISQPLFDELESRCSSISKIEIMVDTSRFVLDEKPTNQDRVTYLGSFASKDGIETILKGFDRFASKRKHTRLLLLGFDPNPAKTKNFIQQLECKDRIDIMGRIPYEEIPRLLASSRCLILSRKNESFSKYGYPTKLGEYLASSRPVLMSDIGAYCDDFKDNFEVIKFKPDSDESLAQALIKTIDSVEESNQIGIRGRELVENRFSIDVQCLRYCREMENLLS